MHLSRWSCYFQTSEQRQKQQQTFFPEKKKGNVLKNNSRKKALPCATSAFDIWPVNLRCGLDLIRLMKPTESHLNLTKGTFHFVRVRRWCSSSNRLTVEGGSARINISTGLWYSLFNEGRKVHSLPVKMNLNCHALFLCHLDTWAVICMYFWHQLELVQILA